MLGQKKSHGTKTTETGRKNSTRDKIKSDKRDTSVAPNPRYSGGPEGRRPRRAAGPEGRRAPKGGGPRRAGAPKGGGGGPEGWGLRRVRLRRVGARRVGGPKFRPHAQDTTFSIQRLMNTNNLIIVHKKWCLHFGPAQIGTLRRGREEGSDFSLAKSQIGSHDGKTKVWNRAGERPQICDVLERIALLQNTRGVRHSAFAISDRRPPLWNGFL